MRPLRETAIEAAAKVLALSSAHHEYVWVYHHVLSHRHIDPFALIEGSA